MNRLGLRIAAKSLLILALPMQTACRPAADATSQSKSLYEALELELVQSDRLTDTEKALGSLQIVMSFENQRFAIPNCTAVRISREYILTANHCVKDSAIFNPQYFAALPLDGQLEIQTYERVVRLGFTGTLDPESARYQTEAPVLEAPVFRDPKNDFAVYRHPLDGPSDTPGIDLALAQDPAEGASLLGYPNGVPLTRASCHHFVKLTPPWFGHDCDALGGASGGLIAAGSVPMALHIAGPANNDGYYYKYKGQFESPEIFAQQRGCPSNGSTVDPECVKARGMNRALPLTLVRTILQEQAPELWMAIQKDHEVKGAAAAEASGS